MSRILTCLHTGYKGRAPVVEWVRVDTPARRGIREHGAGSLKPMKSLEVFARELAGRGLTNQAECDRLFAR